MGPLGDPSKSRRRTELKSEEGGTNLRHTGGRLGHTGWLLRLVRDVICSVLSGQLETQCRGNDRAFTCDFKLSAYLPQAREKVHLLPTG